MTSGTEKMVVNSAIERLISEDIFDIESAQIVISYGLKLQVSNKKITVETLSKSKSSSDEVSGFSPLHGNISIKDKERNEIREKNFGFNKERVGNFRLWKVNDGYIVFHHFWKSSLATRSQDNYRDLYYLQYDPKSFNVRSFGLVKKRVVFSFSFFGRKIAISKPYLEEIYNCGKGKSLINGYYITYSK